MQKNTLSPLNGAQQNHIYGPYAAFSDSTDPCQPTKTRSLVSRTSLSRTRLFRITAYLEVKIWSLL